MEQISEMLSNFLATAAASALRSDAPFGVSERGRSVPFLI
jgi:hypothetical protein